MDKLFFVYGSLKMDSWNHSVLKDSEYLGEYITLQEFLLTDVGFPYMVPKSGYTEATGHPTLPVVGELYRVTDEEVEFALDSLEGVSYGHYKHHEIYVKGYSSLEVYKATTYIPCDQEYAASYNPCNTVNLDNQLCYYW